MKKFIAQDEYGVEWEILAHDEQEALDLAKIQIEDSEWDDDVIHDETPLVVICDHETGKELVSG